MIEKHLIPSLEKVEKFLQQQPALKGTEVYIYAWPPSSDGIRVAEVGYSFSNSKGTGGAAWMQSNPESANVCFYAERLALDYEANDPEEIKTSQWALVYAMLGKEAAQNIKEDTDTSNGN